MIFTVTMVINAVIKIKLIDVVKELHILAILIIWDANFLIGL